MNRLKSLQHKQNSESTDIEVLKSLYGINISIDESCKDKKQSKSLYNYLISSLRNFHREILYQKEKHLVMRRSWVNHGYYCTYIYKIFEADNYSNKTLIHSKESRCRGYKSVLCIFTEFPFTIGSYEKRKGWHAVFFSEEYPQKAEKMTFKKEIEEYNAKNIRWEIVQLVKQDDENSEEYRN